MKHILEYCRPYRRHAKYLSTLDASHWGCGCFVQLKSKIYVIEVGQITVYEASPTFAKLQIITRKEIKCPWGVAACKLNKYIYVSDKDAKCVWQVDQYEEVKLLIADLSRAVKLSVMCNGNVLIVDIKKLIQYKSDGSKLKSVRLPNELTDPDSAVGTPRGTFFVSHSPSGGTNKICEILKNGEILRSFSQREVKPKFAFGMSIDPAGQLFVLDYRNFRILLLDSNLKLKRVMLSQAKYGLYSSNYLSYDADSGNLLIGAFSIVNGKINIYNILPVPD